MQHTQHVCLLTRKLGAAMVVIMHISLLHAPRDLLLESRALVQQAAPTRSCATAAAGLQPDACLTVQPSAYNHCMVMSSAPLLLRPGVVVEQYGNVLAFWQTASSKGAEPLSDLNGHF